MAASAVVRSSSTTINASSSGRPYGRAASATRRGAAGLRPPRSPRAGVSGARPRGERRSREDLRRAVAALEPHLVRARGSTRTVVQVDEEVAVDLHPAVRIAVHTQEPRLETGIELVVPGRVERVADVESPAVERELEHLRPAVQLPSGVARLAEQAPEPELPGQLRVGRVGGVLLA